MRAHAEQVEVIELHRFRTAFGMSLRYNGRCNGDATIDELSERLAMDTTVVSVTIPSGWLEGLNLNEDELRQALELGLAQLRQQQATPDVTSRIIQALLSTGQVAHLSMVSFIDEAPDADRQLPPTLPGTPVSEIIIAQRRGEL